MTTPPNRDPTMRMPGADRAVVDLAKLEDYVLSPIHARGRHKARVFAERLGLTARDAESVRTALLQAAAGDQAIPGESDRFGQRFVVQFTMNTPQGSALIRSAWIVRERENFPRFTTCYII